MQFGKPFLWKMYFILEITALTRQTYSIRSMPVECAGIKQLRVFYFMLGSIKSLTDSVSHSSLTHSLSQSAGISSIFHVGHKNVVK